MAKQDKSDWDGAGVAPLAAEGGPEAMPGGPPDWPLTDLRIRDQLLAAFSDSSWGRYHGGFSEQLIAKLCSMLNVSYTLLTCSGTFAVELALRGLKVRTGDEVVLAAYDFPGNFRAIEAVGATPVIVDIDPDSWCIDPEQFAESLGPATRAVIASHLHGGLADMQKIVTLAKQRGVGVVEDACQAPGAVVQGRAAGSWGDVGVLSFGGSKLVTAGRGGAVVTNDETLRQRMRIFAERGNDAFPLSELQAAVLLPQLDSLEERNERRRSSVQKLENTWAELPLLEHVRAEQQPGLPSYFKVALRYRSQHAGGRSRDLFIAAMQAEGVAVGPGFRGFVRRGTRRCRSVGQLGCAAEAAASTILLHHPALLLPEQDINAIAEAFRKVSHWFGQ